MRKLHIVEPKKISIHVRGLTNITKARAEEQAMGKGFNNLQHFLRFIILRLASGDVELDPTLLWSRKEDDATDPHLC